MREWNSVIKEQLQQYVQTPAVLMGPDEQPYEYREVDGSIHRFLMKRQDEPIPYQLYAFLLDNGITKDQLESFASGLFLNYTSTSDIYV